MTILFIKQEGYEIKAFKAMQKTCYITLLFENQIRISRDKEHISTFFYLHIYYIDRGRLVEFPRWTCGFIIGLESNAK